MSQRFDGFKGHVPRKRSVCSSVAGHVPKYCTRCNVSINNKQTKLTLFIHHTKALSVVNLLNKSECLLGQVEPTKLNEETEKLKKRRIVARTFCTIQSPKFLKAAVKRFPFLLT